MKKLFWLSFFFALFKHSNAQSYNMFFDVGYNWGAGKSSTNKSFNRNDKSIDNTENSIKFSEGLRYTFKLERVTKTSFVYGFKYQYHKGIGSDISLSNNFDTTRTNHEKYYYSIDASFISNFSVYGIYLGMQKCINQNIYLTASLGPLLTKGYVRETGIEIYDNITYPSNSETINYTYKHNFTSLRGVNFNFRADFSANKNIAFFTSFEADYISVYYKNSNIEFLSVNGQTITNNLYPYFKTIEYVKSFNKPDQPDYDKPQQRTRFVNPFHSISIHVGIKINLWDATKIKAQKPMS